MTRLALWGALALSAAALAAVTLPRPTEPTPAGPIPYATVDDGLAATWPCTPPITWTLNTSGAPPAATVQAANAFTTLAAATGLTFTYIGPTTATAGAAPDAADPARPADIIISYDTADAASADLLRSSPDIAGATVTTTRYQPALGLVREPRHSITAADIVLRADTDPAATAALILHEAGHAIGLDHPPDTADSIMRSHLPATGPATLTPTDTAALAALYQPCLSTTANAPTLTQQ